MARVEVLGITPGPDGNALWLWSPHASLTRIGTFPPERALRLAAEMLTRLPGCSTFIGRSVAL